MTKAMSLMIEEMPTEALEIKQNRLYGVEWSRRIFSVACANMMLHKDGKSNIIQGDSQHSEVADCIKKNKPDRILMNPPFEKQKGIIIVENVLKSVEPNNLTAFILPDRTLYTKNQKVVGKILKTNRLLSIIKMPDNVWSGMAGVKTSIFIFKTRIAHLDSDIVKYWIKDDGLETVKNSGRHDIYKTWSDILEPAWVNIINNTGYNPSLKIEKSLYDELCSTKQVDIRLEYVVPEKPFVLSLDDIDNTILERVIFENRILSTTISDLTREVLLRWILRKL